MKPRGPQGINTLIRSANGSINVKMSLYVASFTHGFLPDRRSSGLEEEASYQLDVSYISYNSYCLACGSRLRLTQQPPLRLNLSLGVSPVQFFQERAKSSFFEFLYVYDVMKYITQKSVKDTIAFYM